MGRRQNITKITPTGDTIWRTVAPNRYANRSWDARTIVEDAQGSLLLAGDSELQTGGAGGSSNQIHLVRFTGAGRLVSDTMLFRAGDNYARSAMLAPNGRGLVFSGYTTAGPRGGSDLLLGLYDGFRPLATAPGGAAVAPLQAYPNPVSGPTARATVALPAATAGGRLVLHDGLGRYLGAQPVAPGARQAAVELAGRPPGLYLLRYEQADGRRYLVRLLRE
ncbi:hypothetical protein MUN81_05595 [Hymenobacter sp. 5317J-9]|uniref:hypothetical protein n=1 Tax=Hymenobacter sp. 5317J-9 TaxID=2932250 RepID=UPI001FD6F295|nr:hypothetical protein [Hymenobacter sp. 5317J-9]UOQ98965.1 hypothetical protein MUN81_05595 [Hymenobacter sp. 5317J-9]